MVVIGVTAASACTLNHLRPTFDGTLAALSHAAESSNIRRGRRYLAHERQKKGIMIGGFRCSHILLLIVLVPLGGCLYRSRPVALHMSTAQLQTATGNDLVERINAEATNIQSLEATVTASVGDSKLVKITEYREIRGYILIRKPSSLRMIGVSPILQIHVFDIVSSGQEFKLWIPSKHRLIAGNNDAARPSLEPLENLQPQVIYKALLLQAVDPQSELAVLEGGEHQAIDPRTQEPALQPDYTLNIIKRNGRGWYLSRKLVFDRTDLRPRQQLFYDEHGSVVTDVRYDEYREFNGVFFPTKIQIRRSQEECSIKLEVTTLTINAPITDDQFVLDLPSGAAQASR